MMFAYRQMMLPIGNDVCLAANDVCLRHVEVEIPAGFQRKISKNTW